MSFVTKQTMQKFNTPKLLTQKFPDHATIMSNFDLSKVKNSVNQGCKYAYTN